MALILTKSLARSKRHAPTPRSRRKRYRKTSKQTPNAEPDSDEELGEIADETFGEEDRVSADLIAEAEALERSDADGARRILDEAARLGFDDLGTAMLRDAIRASTKLDRSAVNSGWRGAKAKVEREAKQAEKEAKQREAEEAKQREAEEVQANAERAQAEAEALREQLAERVAPLARDPNLLSRVVAAVHRLGVVREDVAIKATYLTVTSRLLRQGSSACCGAGPRRPARTI